MLKVVIGAIKVILVCLIILSVLPSSAEASIVLRMVATNPSSSKTQTVPVKSYLPQGVQPEHIIDKGDFEVGYDFDQSLYYVFQQVELSPKESLILEVEIEDIWTIAQADLDFLESHLRGITEFLKNTPYAASTQTLSDNISRRLQEIIRTQEEPLVDVEEHISRYEINLGVLKEIKKDLASLEELVIELGGAMPEGRLLGEVYSEEEVIDLEKTDLDIENLETVKLNVTISNPSPDKKRTLPLKYYLPKEVKPEYVVDSGGLDISYDVAKKLYYLYKEDVELEPGGTRQFIIEIRNIWFIPENTIESMRNRSQKMLELLEGTDYYETAVYIVNAIDKDLDMIIVLQSIEETIPEKIIGNYRLNLKNLNNARSSLAKLEKIVIQAGGTPSVALSQAAEEESRFRVDEKIKVAGRSIFRGKIPSVSVTWSLIYIIIGFLAVVSFAFFILQFVQHKQMVTDNLTGIYTRKYVSGKLPQELSRNKMQKANYAILMIDIDGFKDFNDRFGHLVGDTILRETVTTIKRNLRQVDIISRFGGDEFLVGLPKKNKREAQIIARRLVEAVSSHKIRTHLGAEALLVTISVGTAVFPDDAEDYEVLVSKADEALYRAKGKGGNDVFVYGM